MGAIQLPRGLTPGFTQPKSKPVTTCEIDWAHPLARHLIFAKFFSGYNRNLLDAEQPTTLSGSFTSEGYHQTGSEEITYARPSGLSYSNGSVAFNFKSNGTTPATFAKFFHTASSEFQMFRSNGDTKLELEIGSMANDPITFATDIWDQSWHKISATWNDSDNDRNVIVDGESQLRNSSFSAPAGTSDLQLLNRSSDAARSAEGTLGYFLLFDKDLELDKLQEVQRDPYQLLKPTAQIFAFTPASGVTTHTLTANDTFSNTYVDSANILLRSPILINDSGSATSIDGVDITRIHNLDTNETASATSIDSPALLLRHGLTANELLSDISIDSIDLTLKTSVLVNDTSSATTIDNVDIDSNINLEVGDALSTTLIDGSLVLTAKHPLVTNDATSATLIDDVNISITGAGGPFLHRDLWVIDQLGYEGDVRDLWVDWFISQGADGISGDSFNDLATQWLGSLGYTGSLNDRWDAWEQDENIGI